MAQEGARDPGGPTQGGGCRLRLRYAVDRCLENLLGNWPQGRRAEREAGAAGAAAGWGEPSPVAAYKILHPVAPEVGSWVHDTGLCS